MTRLVCLSCGEVYKSRRMQVEPDEGSCTCGGRRVSPSQAKPRKPLARVSAKNAEKVRRQGGSTLKRSGQGMSAAKAQQRKVRGLACVGCGRIIEPDTATGGWSIDAAHLLPRGLGGCSDPLCTVPLCRNEFTQEGCHPDYDAGKLGIHGKLVERGYWAEMAHVVSEHHVSPLTLAGRLTAEELGDVRPLKARVVELEAGIAA